MNNGFSRRVSRSSRQELRVSEGWRRERETLRLFCRCLRRLAVFS
jgi:hypothetical protein